MRFGWAIALWTLAAQVGAQDLALQLDPLVGGLTRPVVIAQPDDDSGRLFIVQQTGEVLIFENGSLNPSPFLDLSAVVSCCGERGLLGLAFHPNYRDNGWFYVNYTDLNGDSVVARFAAVPAIADVADLMSQQMVLTQAQPAVNHNGGALAFGPDGYLYIAFGDGWGGGDQQDNAQNLETWLGKILRADVDGDDFPGDPNRNYAVPPSNPLVAAAGLDEIWAWGLRNPWRFSFDRILGDLWLGDVGQQTWEEINYQPASSTGGENYGWDVLEGTSCFEDDPGGDGSCADFLAGASVLPVLSYEQDPPGCYAVTGGYRYRGFQVPRLFGTYLYADACSGIIWGALPNCSGGWQSYQLLDAPFRVVAFGEDVDGELYVTEYSGTAGMSAVHRASVDPTSGGPHLAATPAVADFGSSTVGSNHSIGLTLENDGGGDPGLVVEGALFVGSAEFAVDWNAGAAPCGPGPICLAPGESCTLEVLWAPQREGGYNDTLVFAANSDLAMVDVTGTVPCTGSDQLVLADFDVATDETHTACKSIAVGPNVAVEGTGRLELRAGESVTLQSSTRVESGGELAIILDPVLAVD